MGEYTLIIILTFVGFVGLAALLLVPVYRFLKREEKAGREWERPNPDGTSPSSNGKDESGAS